MAPPTILAHKSSFLTAQTLQLSQSLAPSAAWREANERADEGLSERVVEEALYRANHALQQHARRVYAPQASRHVAEQIEALYLEAAEKAVRGDDERAGDGEEEGDGDGGGMGGRDVDGEGRFLRVGADFASDEVISTLPATWDLHSPSQAEANPPEAQRYAELASSLVSLSARRKEVRERIDRLSRMRDLLQPFTASDGSGGEDGDAGLRSVQQNLVTRDGELERELERMRVLLVRVAARVGQLPDPGSGPGSGGDVAMEGIDAAEQSKVHRLLDGL
ncbi:kinetochore Sim4 complex subunit Fta4 [Hypoxylon sp. FL1284]|nr:kinetochore Sim4 complex subunit Fta4 [Hypoxylon sp. FL1284]